MVKKTKIDRELLKALCRLGAETMYRQLLVEYPDLALVGQKMSLSMGALKTSGAKTIRTRRAPSRAARKAMSRGMRRYWRRRKDAEHARRQAQ